MPPIAALVADDCVIPFTPDVDAPLGAVVVVGALVGVAQRAIPARVLGALALRGLYDVPRVPGAALPMGTRLFWDAAAQRAVADAAGGANRPLGASVATAQAEAATVRVALNHPG